MFALLKETGQGPQPAIQWQQELIQADSSTTAAQQQETSFLDRLAAPTVFMQQALLFQTQLCPQALKAAVAAALQQYPTWGCRLVNTQEGGLQAVPSSPTGSSGVAFLLGHSSTLSTQQLLGMQATEGQHTQPANQHVATAATAAVGQAADKATDPAAKKEASSMQQMALELPDLLFSHLPGSLTPNYVNSDLPLVHVALLQLQGGGSLLGVHMSHFLGDWTSCRLLLRCLAAAYSNAILQQQQERLQEQQQQQQQQLPALLSGAPLLNKLVAAVQQLQQQQQTGGEGWTPVRLKPLEQPDTERFQKLAALQTAGQATDNGSKAGGGGGSNGSSGSSSLRPVRLSYHVSMERTQQLKQQLLTDAASTTTTRSSSSSSSSNNNSSWCTAHNALLASVLAAFGRLPSRRGLPHDVSVAVDMRHRLPTAQQQLLQQQEQQQLGVAVGNFFASAIVEDCCLSVSNRVQLAQALHAAVRRAAEVWLPDLAWAAGVKQFKPEAAPATTTATAAAAAEVQQAPQEAPTTAAEAPAAAAAAAATAAAEGVSAGEVTWRRLHAMGPSALLQQQMGLGLLASVSTTQWPLDFGTDACFGGQLPCLAVPSFSQPQPYPLVLTQQATPAQGGGWMVHVFLDAAEAAA